MWKQTTSFCLFVVVFIINHSFSAIFWYFKTKSSLDDYTDSRATSFHRGLLLAYSTEQKKLLCEDLFSAQLYVTAAIGGNGVITDGQGSEGQHHPLIVSEISLPGEEYNVKTANEIFIECFGKKFDNRKPISYGEVYVSHGFHYGRWFASTRLEVHDRDRIILGYNIGASPQNVPLKPPELEERYLATRETIEALKTESLAYVHLVERKDDLLALPKWQRAVLCASILSSPIYRQERLEYSTKWILQHKDNLKYEEIPLTFAHDTRRSEKTFMCDCLICKGFANAATMRTVSQQIRA